MGLWCVLCRYESLDRRLDSLESTLLTLLHNVKVRCKTQTHPLLGWVQPLPPALLDFV